MTGVDTDIELKIDKSKWKPVRLGDVVEESRATVKDANKERIERIVGLEHIDSESIHLRRWDTLDKRTTFTKCFEKGQVLFGRRRAYLKKAALATFDGICSGDITVLQAKKELLPELLPFLINNDKFFDYAVKNSAGSLSPRAKFKDLANYEFLLPPKDQQARLAELLWAADEMVEKKVELFDRLKLIQEIRVRHTFNLTKSAGAKRTKLGFIQKGWGCLTLDELLDSGIIVSHLDGNHGSFYPKSDEFVNSGVPYISANCINGDKIDFSKAKFLTEKRANEIQKGIALDGDVLLAHNATVGPVCILQTKYKKVILSTTLTYYRPNTDQIDRDYLFYYMRSSLFQNQLERVMSQSTRDQVPITTQRKLLFILPPMDIQRNISSELSGMDESARLVSDNIFSSRKLQKSLINQIF